MPATIVRRALARTAMVVVCAVLAACVASPDVETAAIASELAGAKTIAFQDGVAPTNAYAGTRDTFLTESDPLRNDGTSSALRADGDAPTNTGKDLVALLRWDVSSIPSSATVRAAAITINVTNKSGGTYALYEAKRAWVETQASWNAAASGAAWEIPGAKGPSDRGTTVLGSIAASASGTYTVTLNAAGVAVVQKWVATPSANAGLVVAGSSADQLAWSSREATSSTQRPKLSVGFDPPADAGSMLDASTTPTAATTYYVDDVAGSDAASGTSPATAWRSLAKASAAPLAPGDRLLFRRGGAWTGTLTVSRSGTASAPIVVGAYGDGELPIVKQGSSCVKITGSYVAVEAIHADDCTWAGFEISGSHDEVRDAMATHNVAGVEIESGATSNRVLRNAIVDNAKMSVLTPGGDDDSGAFGILLHGDSNEIAWNRISGCDAFSYDYGRDGAAIEVYGGRGNVIHHNVAEQNDAFTELGSSRSADNTYAYNVVRSTLANSVFLVTRGAASSFGPVANTRAYDNTVYLTGSSSQGFVCHAGCSASILVMRNNVIQAAWKVGYADAPFDEDYDLFFQGQIQFTRGAHTLVADPRFVSPSTGDFHLLATSPAIDSGASGLGWSTDLDGNPVPREGNGDGVTGVDRGAYER